MSQEQHERMIRYLQSRLNDLRDENLALRERFKTSNYLQQHVGLGPKLGDILDYSCNGVDAVLNPVGASGMNNVGGGGSCGDSIKNDDNCIGGSLYTPSIDGDYQLEAKNELLQQKLNELQKLQIQLNNV